MRKTITKLTLLLALATAGVQNSWAQFSGELKDTVRNSYITRTLTFSLTDVATQLGTDTLTLATYLNSWSEGITTVVGSAPSTIYVMEGTAKSDSTYNQGAAGGYWLNNDGVPTAWGKGSTFYAYPTWSTADDAFTFYIGQFPDSFKNGAVANVKFLLEYNGKEATFDIKYDVKGYEKIDPTAKTLKTSDFTVVATKALSIEQTSRKNQNAESYQIDITTELAALTDETLKVKDNLDSLLYSQYYDADNDVKQDTLSRYFSSTKNGSGWWFYAQSTDGETHDGPAYAAVYNASNSVYYIDGFSLSDGILSYNVGQNSGVAEIGKDYTSTAYLVYKEKAIQFDFTLKFAEAQILPLAQMQKMGETRFELGHQNASASGSVTLNADSVAQVMGVEVANLKFLANSSTEGELDDNTTANNGGYWLSTKGVPYAWGTTEANAGGYVEPATSGVYTTLNWGTGSNFSEDMEFSLYLVADDKYYALTFDVDAPAKFEGDMVIVDSIDMEMEVIPASGYGQEKTYNVDIDYITELVGGTPTFYAFTAPDTTVAGSVAEKTSAYSCTPYPGFWMNHSDTEYQNMNAFAGSWGSSATNAFGITYASGVFTMYDYPGARSVGDTYKAEFLFLNESTGKAVKIKATVTHVSEYSVTLETVGNESVQIQSGQDDNIYTAIDFTKALAAFGLTDADELLASSTISVKNANGKFIDSYYSDTDGFMFGEDGTALDPNDEASQEKLVYYIKLEQDETEVPSWASSYIGGFENPETDSYRSSIGIDYDGKRYIYNITVVTPQYTGIASVDSDDEVKAGDVYSVAGAVVRKNATSLEGLPAGAYIFNGKKYIVK